MSIRLFAPSSIESRGCCLGPAAPNKGPKARRARVLGWRSAVEHRTDPRMRAISIHIVPQREPRSPSFFPTSRIPIRPSHFQTKPHSIRFNENHLGAASFSGAQSRRTNALGARGDQIGCRHVPEIKVDRSLQLCAVATRPMNWRGARCDAAALW